MTPFAKLYEYPDGQLLVYTNHNVETDRDEIIFRTDVNGLQLQQTLGFPVGESSDEVFKRVTKESSERYFDNLKGLGSMGTVDIEKPSHSAFNLAVQVENMRNAQIAYFELSARAKKTKLPEDYAAARKMLQISKKLEACVDDTLISTLKPVKEVTG